MNNKDYSENIRRAVEFIEGNLDRKILLKDIAREAMLSEFHFHRIFKTFKNETVKEYTSRLKLERAAVRIKHSRDEIGHIALESGYENHETFTRAFQSHFGISPVDYRDAMQQTVVAKRTLYENTRVDLKSLGVAPPVIRELADLDLAFVRHVGSYEKVAGSFQKLMLWAASHLALKLAPVTLGIVHDNPDLTDEEKIRFDACVLLSKPLSAKGEIGYKRIEGGKFAVFRYQGPYDSFYPVYDYIYNVTVFEQGWQLADKPALEWYVKSPPFYSPSRCVTDFYLPII